MTLIKPKDKTYFPKSIETIPYFTPNTTSDETLNIL